MTESLKFRAERICRSASPRRGRRWRRTGIDLLIVTDPSNMAWLTGYDGWSFYVHQAVLVRRTATRSGTAAARTPTAPSAPPVWPTTTSSATPTTTCSRPNATRWTTWPASSTQRGWGRLTIGVEMDNYWFSAAAFASLQQHLPNARFADATGAGELAARGQEPGRDRATCGTAARIVEAMHARIFETRRTRHAQVRPRRRDLRRRHRAASTAIGGDYPAIVPLLPSGADASAPHLTWDDRPMQHGRRHVLRDRRLLQPLPLPAVAHVFLGKPTAGIPRRRDRRRWKAWRPASAAAKPGNTCEDIAKRLLRRARRKLRHREGQPHAAIRSASAIRRTGASAR